MGKTCPHLRKRLAHMRMCIRMDIRRVGVGVLVGVLV